MSGVWAAEGLKGRFGFILDTRLRIREFSKIYEVNVANVVVCRRSSKGMEWMEMPSFANSTLALNPSRNHRMNAMSLNVRNNNCIIPPRFQISITFQRDPLL